MRTKGTGSLNLGTNNSNDLTIANGGAVSTVGNITAGGDIVTAVGSAGAPSHTFTGDTDTGMYRAGTNQLGFTAGSTQVLQLATTDVDVTTGHLNVISNTGSPTIKLGEWSAGSNYAAIETDTGYLILGSGTGVDESAYLRTKGTGSLQLGTNGSTDLEIANGGAISTIGNLTVGGILYTTNIDGTGGAAITANYNNRQGFYSGYNLLPYTSGSNYFRATDHRFQGEGGGTYWMIVGSTQTTVYGSLRVSNETTLTGNSTGELRVTSDYGYADFGPKNASACHIYTDRPGFYMDKYLNMNGGSTVRGALTLSSGSLTLSNGNIQVFGRHYIDLNYAGVSWSGYQLLVQSANTSTSSNLAVGMTFHNRRYGIAPILRNYGPYGETLDFTNNPGTAFIPIRASAFQINSTIRVKDDIRAVEDADAIKMAEDFLLVSYMPKVRPQTMRTNERFNRIDAKWQESGRPPLTSQPAYTDPYDHDCSIDNCDGSLGNECPVTVNDTRVYSGLAEWTGETNPEIAFFDEGGIAESLDVAQIASSALGAAGSLSRKLTLAMETIDSLQDRLAVLEQVK